MNYPSDAHGSSRVNRGAIFLMEVLHEDLKELLLHRKRFYQVFLIDDLIHHGPQSILDSCVDMAVIQKQDLVKRLDDFG